MVFLATVFLLSYLCEAEFSDVSQPVSVQTLKLGESATIKCFLKSIINNRVWYKLTAERRLQVVATYSHRYNWSIVDDELKHRYSVNSNGINNHLTISAASWDDAGTYFCGVLRLYDIQFGSGTLLILKGAKLNHSVVRPPKSQSGDAMPFSCTFKPAQCTAEDIGVGWLNASQRSSPEIIDMSGKTDDSCKRTERGETTCVHKFLIKDVNSDGGGTYYCAATACRQMQLENVTTAFNSGLDPTVVVLVTSNIIFGITTLFLSWMLCKFRRKASSGAPKRSFVDQAAESVIYSSVSSPHRSVDRRSSEVSHSSVVYSDIRS